MTRQGSTVRCERNLKSMKRLDLLGSIIVFFAMSAGCTPCEECDCQDEARADKASARAAAVGDAAGEKEMEALEEEFGDEVPGGDVSRQFTLENAFMYDQINGAGDRKPTLAIVLFEYEKEESVKYQVAYVACTCRGPSVNYHSVAYVELSKEDGSLVFMSYDKDPSGHYAPGLYGDSTVTSYGTPVKAMFDRFREEKLVGRTQGEIRAIEPMHGEVDGYTGATVTPNNSVMMLEGLFEYHNARYM